MNTHWVLAGSDAATNGGPGEVVAWVSAGVALVAAGAAVWQAVVAQRARGDAKESAAAAESSAAEAAVSAASSADALQRLADVAELEASRLPVPWRFERAGKSGVVLVNDSDEVCRGVTMTCLEEHVRLARWSDGVDIHGRASVQFQMVSPVRNPGIHISWHTDRHPDLLEWDGEIPSRP